MSTCYSYSLSGFIPPELQKRHKEILGSFDSKMFFEKKSLQEKLHDNERLLTRQFERTEKIQINEIEKRKENIDDSIEELKKSSRLKMKNREINLQRLILQWIPLAKRKIAIKFNNDVKNLNLKKKTIR